MYKKIRLQIALKQKKGASKKVPKLEQKWIGDWDMVNSLRLPQLFICGLTGMLLNFQ